jgi:hypothetical protein
LNARVATCVGVGLAVLIGAGLFVASRPGGAETPRQAEPSSTSVATMAPAGASSPAPLDTPTASAAPASPTADPARASDAASFAGMLSTLTPEQDAASSAFATQLAVALTTQSPADYTGRTRRLAPYFTAGSAAAHLDGPAQDNADATASPDQVNWVQPFNPNDPNRLGILVSVHFDISEPTANGGNSFGPGDVVWKLWLVQDGTGWRAANAKLESVTF